MAQSPSHRFGQVVGNLLEEILLPELLRFCEEHGLYLDRHGSRAKVRPGKKVKWEDRHGNFHDLDLVIEKGGSDRMRGRPIAFIEAAWRRYTKHSRNKAQEIQGAVLPIAEKHELESPLLGAVLAGEFTAPSLQQLRSLGFQIVYLPYAKIMAAFDTVGIDARFDEDTPDQEFCRCVEKIEALSEAKRSRIKQAILESDRTAFDALFDSLRRRLDRLVGQITIMPLFGEPFVFASPNEAVAFLRGFDRSTTAGRFRKHEVTVHFSNGDEVRGSFGDEENAVRFLGYVTAPE
jgi:hypothetical protein